MVYLSNELWFPPLDTASQEGLLAVGGGLEPERLLLAYRSGIFPWYNAGEPILWWSPDPRMVLFPENLKVSKSLRKVLRKETFRITYDQAFSEVMKNCARIPRHGQDDTWITSEMITAYQKLHEMGKAVSVEVWLEDELVGGLYGVDLPERKLFCGESMFSKVSDASKVGFYHLVQKLKEMDYKLIDCQVHTDHLESLGAEEISRAKFLTFL